MAQLQPHLTIAEGDVVLIRARVRAVWHDAVVVRVPIRDGSSAYHQLSVPPSALVACESAVPLVLPAIIEPAGESP